MTTGCPFCSPGDEDIVLQNALCYARHDRYPVTNGHLLIIPFRHEANFFSLTEEERTAAVELLWRAQSELGSRFAPDGFNVGVNVGEAAGQTILHAHIHLIPRSLGDIPDPRGGIRWIIPQKAAYWSRGSMR